MSPKEIRESLQLPRIVVAVRAGVSEPTVKLYEANPAEGVTAPMRRKLELVYASLAKQIEAA